MALIKCPNCGGMVTTTVNKCIHCGTEFKLCPECQTPVTADSAFCPECGCVLNAPKETDTEIKEQPKAADTVQAADEPETNKTETQKIRCTDIRSNWELDGVPGSAKVLNKIDTIFTSIYVVGILTFIVGIVFSFFDVFGDMSDCIAIGVLLHALSAPFAQSELFEKIAELINHKNYWKWCNARGYDLAAAHRDEVAEIDRKGEVSDWATKLVEVRHENESSMKAMYYNSKQATGTSIVVIAVLKFVVFSVTTAILTLFGLANVNSFHRGMSIENLDLLSLFIIGTVIEIIAGIAFKIVTSVYRGKLEKMMESIEKGEPTDL